MGGRGRAEKEARTVESNRSENGPGCPLWKASEEDGLMSPMDMAWNEEDVFGHVVDKKERKRAKRRRRTMKAEMRMR